MNEHDIKFEWQDDSTLVVTMTVSGQEQQSNFNFLQVGGSANESGELETMTVTAWTTEAFKRNNWRINNPGDQPGWDLQEDAEPYYSDEPSVYEDISGGYLELSHFLNDPGQIGEVQAAVELIYSLEKELEKANLRKVM